MKPTLMTILVSITVVSPIYETNTYACNYWRDPSCGDPPKPPTPPSRPCHYWSDPSCGDEPHPEPPRKPPCHYWSDPSCVYAVGTTLEEAKSDALRHFEDKCLIHEVSSNLKWDVNGNDCISEEQGDTKSQVCKTYEVSTHLTCPIQ
jgi:hypothetical protein